MPAKPTRDFNFILILAYLTLTVSKIARTLFCNDIRGLWPEYLVWSLTSKVHSGNVLHLSLGARAILVPAGWKLPRAALQSPIRIPYINSSQQQLQLSEKEAVYGSWPSTHATECSHVNDASIKSSLKQVLFSNGIWWQIFCTWSICSFRACPGIRKIQRRWGSHLDVQTTDASSKHLYFKTTVNLQDASAHPSEVHLCWKP